MGIAPLVARVRKDVHPWFAAGAAATPPSGAPYMGDVNGGPINLTAELYLGAMGWVDVNAFVRYASMVNITRGLPNQTTQMTPQTAGLTFDNRSGNFSRRNPLGQWYGLIGKNTPLRISRWQNGIKRVRGVFEVPEWPIDWDTTQTDVFVAINPAGSLRRFNAQSATLGSAMYRWYTLQPTPTAPLAYWPCQDAQFSTSIASGLSAGIPMAVGAAPTYASSSTFPSSDALPVVNGSTWTGAVPAYSGTPTLNGLNLLISIPASGDTNGAIVATMYTTGTVTQLQLVYSTANSGSLYLLGYNAVGTQVVNTLAQAVGGCNGYNTLAQVSLSAVTSPFVGVSAGVTLNGVNSSTQGTQTSSGQQTALTGDVIGQTTTVVINQSGSAGLVGSAVGHIAAFAVTPASTYYPVTSLFYGNVPPFLAWSGENPYDRFLRLCLEQGVTGVVQYAGQSESLNPTGLGYQANDTFVNLLQQCFDTDLGLPYELADQLGLGARTRLSLYNQSTTYNSVRPVLVLDYNQNQLAAVPKPSDDDLYTANDVTVSRSGGSSARYTLTSGPESTQAPPAGAGPYPKSPPISLSADSLLADQAAWRVHLGTVAEPRYPVVTVNLRRASANGQTTLLNQALTVDVGDMLQILNPPAALLGPDTINALIVGYSETMGTWEHSITFVAVPSSPYAVGVLDDTILGHADTDGSTLAQTYPLGTETSLSVATTGAATGSPLWTTTAGDFPFDLNIGGERVTVTNITGGSSPQTFAVTRSVNGIVKPQYAGADVRLWQPMILSL